MHLRSFIIGAALGALVTAAAFLWFGDEIRGNVAAATQVAGEKVEAVGEKIGEAGREIR